MVGNSDNKKSTIGYVYMIEVEYVAMIEATKELVWL